MSETAINVCAFVLFAMLLCIPFGIMISVAWDFLQPVLVFFDRRRVTRRNKEIQLELARHGVTTAMLSEEFLSNFEVGIWVEGEFQRIELPFQVGMTRDGEFVPVPKPPVFINALGEVEV